MSASLVTHGAHKKSFPPLDAINISLSFSADAGPLPSPSSPVLGSLRLEEEADSARAATATTASAATTAAGEEKRSRETSTEEGCGIIKESQPWGCRQEGFSELSPFISLSVSPFSLFFFVKVPHQRGERVVEEKL